VLSVVVPVFNVEPWLAACLDSILAQPVRRIEVILVDDGSQDGSVALAEKYVARDARFSLHRHERNQGLSVARNTGVSLATAPFLTFVDSDDTLPPDAWGTAIAALTRTGSDFSVGKAVRVSAERRFVPTLMQRNHAETRLGVKLDDAPLLLADVFAWNKIFRRDFWDRAGLSFPPGMLYEDQPVMTQAFLAAGTVDVLADEVYEWALRADQSSISQGRGELRNVEHRRATKLVTRDLVRERGSARLMDVLLREILPIDMWEHYRAVRADGDEYWHVLRDMQTQIWNPETVPFEATTVPVQQRLMGVLVDQDRRADLLALIDYLDALPGGVQFEEVDGQRQAVLPFRDDPSIPQAAYVEG
jgi:CDP-glycerol glycerophosphotransferase